MMVIKALFIFFLGLNQTLSATVEDPTSTYEGTGNVRKLGYSISFLTFSVQDESSAQALIKVAKAYETHVKRPCVILALKATLNPLVLAEFPSVGLSTPKPSLELWMRKDNHGTKFDTGCTIVVTKADSLEKGLERKFKNLLWITLDRLPKNEPLEVENPVIELMPNTIFAHCPFMDKPMVSFYNEYVSKSIPYRY